MQTESHKKARVAVFLNRSALGLMMLPVACLFWALSVYPPQTAGWLCFFMAVYLWPMAGVLFVISAGFQVRTPGKRLKRDIGLRQAHGH